MAANDDFLAGFSEGLVQLPQRRPAATSSIDFGGLLRPPIRLHEDLKEGCGGQMWPAGVVLSRYLLRQHRHDLSGRSIIELGAGGGLVGLAVSLGCNISPTSSVTVSEGRRPLYMTDQASMLPLMRQNIALNSLSACIEPLVYDWGTVPPVQIPMPPDIILAADCVYLESSFPLLQKTLEDLIGPSTVCYFCFKKRRRADLHFVKTIKKIFNVKLVDDDPERVVYERDNIFLFKITKRMG